MSRNKQWYVEGKGFYLVMYCKEEEIPEMLEQAEISQDDIIGHHKLTHEEWKEHLLAGRAKLVSIRGRATWIGGSE